MKMPDPVGADAPARSDKQEEAAKNALPDVNEDAVAANCRIDEAYWASLPCRIKHFLMFISVGLIRFVLIIGILVIYALGLRFFSLVHWCKLEDVQLQGGLARKWFLFGKPLSMLILKIFGVRVTRRGDESIYAHGRRDGQNEARFVVANHVSMLDIFALFGAGMPDAIPSFVSKAGVFNAPIIGTLLRACRGVPVYRSSATGTGTSQVLVERAKNEKEPAVAIFPEGTTTNGTCVITLHAGAFASGAPVKPICLKYTFTGFSPAYEVLEPFEWIYGILGSTGISLEMTSLPVYVPSEEEKRDARIYARNVGELLANELQMPLRNVTFKHKLAYMVKFRNYKMKEHED